MTKTTSNTSKAATEKARHSRSTAYKLPVVTDAKKAGAGKGNWGRTFDELDELNIPVGEPFPDDVAKKTYSAAKAAKAEK